MHIVFGQGNLGIDLVERLKEQSESVIVYKNKYPHEFTPELWEVLYDLTKNGATVWNTVGAGSINEAKQDFKKTLDAHVGLVVELIEKLPDNATLINFSSNYVADEEWSVGNPNHRKARCESLYALSKKMMEEVVITHSKENVYALRVANLYGNHKPEKTFPFKIWENRDKIQTLPPNYMCPTPTDWLARHCINTVLPNLNSEQKVYNLAPQGQITVKDFAEMIAGKRYKWGHKDLERPFYSNIGNCFDIEDSWLTLWKESKLNKMLRQENDKTDTTSV